MIQSSIESQLDAVLVYAVNQLIHTPDNTKCADYISNTFDSACRILKDSAQDGDLSPDAIKLAGAMRYKCPELGRLFDMLEIHRSVLAENVPTWRRLSGMQKVIQFCGPKGCGKSTIAVRVAEILNLPIISAAATLKKMIAVLLQEYGLNSDRIKYYITNPIGKEEVIPEIGVTPRFMMETLGTNWGRQTVNHNLWSNIARRKLELGGISDDTRFPQEVVPGSILIEVVRPGVKYNPDIPSEAGLPQSVPRTFVLHNTGTVDEAVQEVLKVVNG